MSLVKVFKYILVIVVVGLLAVLPSVNMTDYVQSTITSKFMVFAYGCMLLVAGYVIMYIISKPQAIQISRLDIILLLIFGYITINRYVIQDNYSFSIRYMELLGIGIIYVILRNLPQKIYIWLLLVIVISGTIQAIYGNLQLLGYYPSNHSGFMLTGSFFNPGPYAGFLASVWPIALGMHLFRDKILERVSFKLIKITILNNVFNYISIIGVVSILLVIPATHSRGAWLSVLLSSILLLEFRYHFVKNTFKKLTQGKKLALIIFALGIFFSGVFGIYHFKKGSADGRLFIWEVTSEIIKDFPITGVGFDRFKTHYMNYQADYFVKHVETIEALVADNTYYAFNEWLQFVTENGLVGFLLLVVVLFIILKIKVAQKNNYFFLIAKTAFLAIGVFALFSYPMQILPIKLVMLVLLSLLANLDISKYSIFVFDKDTKQYGLWSLKGVVFIVGFVALSKGITYVQALDLGFKTWQNALTIYQYGAYEDAIIEYKKAYSILKKDGNFLMNYGKALSIHKQNENAVQVLKEAKQHINTTIIETALGDAYKSAKQYDEAETAYKHAANMIPVRFYPLYLQAKLYEESGENEKAIAMAKMILNKNEKVPSTAIKEIKAEMKNIIRNAKR